MRITGVIHAHSDLSHDGTMTVRELREAALERELKFICLTDHAEGHSREELDRLREECEENSDERFLAVPGLEYRCLEGIDLLGLGVTEPAPGPVPHDVARFIRERGGVVAWAHPFRRQLKAAEGLGPLLDAVEVWNGRMESEYTPSPQRLAIYDILRKEAPELPAFGALDLHVIGGFKTLFLEADFASLTRDALFEALRKGNFTTRGRWLRMSSQPRYNPGQLLFFRCIQAGLHGYRGIRKRLGWRED